VLLVLSAPCQLLVLAGPEHGRTSGPQLSCSHSASPDGSDAIRAHPLSRIVQIGGEMRAEVARVIAGAIDQC
jgi:hypothetical protein